MSNDKVIEFPNRHPDELPPGDASSNVVERD